MSILGTFADLASGNGVAGVAGLASGVAGTAAGLALQGISSWVLNGTKGALEEVASAIGSTTAPNLDGTWFSSTYWRVAALAAMLTIPFLCAAAVQAVARGDLGLLARSAFGYLPLSILGVSLAAPMTMLLLACTDQMSSVVSASAATGGARFLDHAAQIAGALSMSTTGSPFFAVVVGLLAVMAALALAIELLIRAAAVYVVVLMLPLAFAALVWPARRVWAARLVELLVSLVLSKFVIVAVLSLAAAAFAGGTPGIGELLVAMSLLMLSTFAPWALMRVLPFTELAAGASGILHGELSQIRSKPMSAAGLAGTPGEVAAQMSARLREQARRADYGGDRMDHARGDRPDPAAGQACSGLDGAGPLPGRSPATDGMSAGATGGEPSSTFGGMMSPNGTGSTSGTAVQDDGRPPFELPEAWRRDEPVRLDERLRPPGQDADQPEGRS